MGVLQVPSLVLGIILLACHIVESLPMSHEVDDLKFKVQEYSFVSQRIRKTQYIYLRMPLGDTLQCRTGNIWTTGQAEEVCSSSPSESWWLASAALILFYTSRTILISDEIPDTQKYLSSFSSE